MNKFIIFVCSVFFLNVSAVSYVGNGSYNSVGTPNSVPNYTKIEAILESKCDKEGIVNIFLNSPSVSFAEADFEIYEKNKVDIVLNDVGDPILSESDIKRISASIGCEIGYVEIVSRPVTTNKVEVDVNKSCNQARIVEAFTSNPKVISVKSDFETSTGGSNEVEIYTNSYLANMEIKNIADSAGCKAIFVERK